MSEDKKQESGTPEPTKPSDGEQETPEQPTGGRDKRINELVADKHKLKDKAEFEKAKREEIEAELEQIKIKAVEAEVKSSFPNAAKHLEDNDLVIRADTPEEYRQKLQTLEEGISKGTNDSKPEGEGEKKPADKPEDNPEGKPKDKPNSFNAPAPPEPQSDNELNDFAKIEPKDVKTTAGYRDYKAQKAKALPRIKNMLARTKK